MIDLSPLKLYPFPLTNGKCPKVLNTKVSDNMTYANSTDPEGPVLSRSTLFAIPLSSLRNNCIKSKIYAKKVWNRVFIISGYLPYCLLCIFIIFSEKKVLEIYHIRLNYCTVRLGFLKLLGKFVVKYVSTY